MCITTRGSLLLKCNSGSYTMLLQNWPLRSMCEERRFLYNDSVVHVHIKPPVYSACRGWVKGLLRLQVMCICQSNVLWYKRRCRYLKRVFGADGQDLVLEVAELTAPGAPLTDPTDEAWLVGAAHRAITAAGAQQLPLQDRGGNTGRFIPWETNNITSHWMCCCSFVWVYQQHPLQCFSSWTFCITAGWEALQVKCKTHNSIPIVTVTAGITEWYEPSASLYIHTNPSWVSWVSSR